METCGAPHPSAIPPPPSRHPSPSPANSPTLALLSKARHRAHLPQIQARLVKTHTIHNNFYLSKLISLLLQYHLFDDAHKLLCHAKKPNTLVFNTLLKALVDHGRPLEALELYKLMLHHSVPQDSYTFPFVLKPCEALSMGSSVHGMILKLGFDWNLHVMNSLISFYCKCLCVDEGRKVFDEMVERDLISFTSMLSGYAKAGDVKSAMELFGSMPERDVVAWGAIISGFAQNGFSEEVLCLFRQMQMCGIPLSEVAIVSAISACASLGLRSLGLWLHALVVRHGVGMTVFMGTALVDMYGKCGDIDNARKVFSLMSEKSPASWNAMIGGLAMNSSYAEAISVFEEMMEIGSEPNSVTLSSILSACRHGGLVDKGRYFFGVLSRKYGISLNLDHYGCMVDLLGRAGYLHEAYELIQTMPMEPNEVVWGALLGACKIHGNLELGEWVLEKLVELDPSNGGNDVLLSNMYAELGRWESVERVRSVMRDRRVEKTRGCSTIEIESMIHEFSAGASPVL